MVYFPLTLPPFPGSDFQCNTHIIPVKNEEGVVMMFILNFEYVVDEESDNSTEKISPTSPTKSDQSKYCDSSFSPNSSSFLMQLPMILA